MWRSTININLSLFLFAFLLLSAVPVMADEESDWIKALKNSSESGSQKQSANAAAHKSSETSGHDSSDSATINDTSPIDLRSYASKHLKNGDIDAAIKFVERAIELQPEDTDARQIYADALEQKVKAQIERDPHTYNQCLKQWYYLYKNAEYPEMGNLAAKHLKDLTGRSPYVWPTARIYLGKVLMPEVGKDGATAAVSEEPAQIH